MALTPQVRPLTVEAVGDDFVQLSGKWIDNARVAAGVRQASAIWAFVAADWAAIEAMLDALPHAAGERIVGLVPGAHPAWGEEGAAICHRLAGFAGETAGMAGLLLSVPAPDCGACQGSCATCGKADAKNEPSDASI